MKIELLEKIINGIIKIVGLAKTKKKKKKMPDTGTTVNNTTTNNTITISPNTQILFTLKGFIATILTILGMFIGFYKLVIIPAMNQSNIHQKELYIEQKEFISEEFDDIRGAIKKNTDAITANNNRFRDLNNSIGEENSSGSLSATTTEAVSDTSLASTHD